jgi:hypothetical protein
MSRTQLEKELEEPRSEFLLWLGFLLPPLAWSAHLETLYLLSEYACFHNNFLPNHVASAVFLILSLIGGAVAWSNWQRSGAEWPDSSSSPISRSLFMSALGLLGGALFSALVFAQWLPTITGVPCGK